MRQNIRSFDRKLIGLVSLLPGWLKPLMVALSMLGEPIITLGLSALVVGIGLGENWDMLTIAGATSVITIAVASLLKLTLRRQRPANSYTSSFIFDTFSFPSGHATGSVVSFGLLATLIALSSQSAYALIISVFISLVILIGISRVYLGAHYPSDIIGGWIIGSLGLTFILLELLT